MLRNKYSNQTPDTLSLFCSDFTHLVTRFSYNLRNTTKVILEPTYVQFESVSCQVHRRRVRCGQDKKERRCEQQQLVGRGGKRREEEGRGGKRGWPRMLKRGKMISSPRNWKKVFNIVSREACRYRLKGVGNCLSCFDISNS